MLLFRLWIWNSNRKVEKTFVKQLDQEQDTVRINWAKEFGSEHAQGRHHLRKR
jgi:hypothetical protein